MSYVPHNASAPGASQSAGDGTTWPPSWKTMPHGISVGRYIDPAFQKLEYEKLWKKVWQVAALPGCARTRVVRAKSRVPSRAPNLFAPLVEFGPL